MSLLNELNAIITKETNLTSSNGKVANFAYTQEAYDEDSYSGQSDFDVSRGNNIPLGTSSVLKTNNTVLEKGVRSQASSLTRHLLNHFFGRVSYNLNKANDWIKDLATALKDNLGEPNGIATLGENGKLDGAQSPFASEIPMDNESNNNVKDYIQKMTISPLLGGIWKYGINGGTGTGAWITPVFAKGRWVTADRSISSALGIRYSYDGITWADSNITNRSFSKIAYGNNTWVATSNNEDGIKYSSDGITWEDCGITAGSPTNLIYIEGVGFFASIVQNIGTDVYTKTILFSSNGQSWELKPLSGTFNNDYITKVFLFINSSEEYILLVATGAGISYAVYDPDFGAFNNWVKVTTGRLDNNVLTLCVGDNAVVGASTTSGKGGIYYSKNGYDWDYGRKSAFNVDGYFYTPVFSNGVFVATHAYKPSTTGNQGAVTSYDGRTWYNATGTDFSTTNWNRITCANGRWIATCASTPSHSNKGVMWSNDGINFIQSDSSNIELVNQPIYFCGVWIGICYKTGDVPYSIYLSRNEGKSWHIAYRETQVWDFVYADGVLIASNSYNSGLMYSSYKDLLSAFPEA